MCPEIDERLTVWNSPSSSDWITRAWFLFSDALDPTLLCSDAIDFASRIMLLTSPSAESSPLSELVAWSRFLSRCWARSSRLSSVRIMVARTGSSLGRFTRRPVAS